MQKFLCVRNAIPGGACKIINQPSCFQIQSNKKAGFPQQYFLMEDSRHIPIEMLLKPDSSA